MKFNLAGKVTLCGLLALSMSCLGQVVSTGGYAATTGANAPLVSTPDIALPGSGPAVGVPLGSANNDSRVSLGPSVYDPNVIVMEAGEGATGTVPQSTAPANNEAFSMGIQTFVSGLPGAANSAPSLAEIAAHNKARISKSVRTINNETIADLNARSVQTGNLGIGNTVASATASSGNPALATASGATTPTAPPANGTLMAKSEAPMLPQSDEVPGPSPTASQQRHPQAQPQSASSSANAKTQPPQGQATANQQPAPANREQLPQTGSVLPLVFLFGVIAVVGGALYFVRR